MWTKNH